MISVNTSDGTLFKIIGAGYAVHVADNNNTNKKPLKLYDYCLSSFDGAFASKCLEGFVGVATEYGKSLMGYSVESVDSYILSAYTMYVSYVSINQENIINLLIQANAFDGNGLSVLLMSMVLTLICASFFYREKLRAVKDSQAAQKVLAVIIGVTASKLAGYLNPTFVNIVYTTLWLRRQSTCFTKLTNPLVKPLETRLISLSQKFYKQDAGAKIEVSKFSLKKKEAINKGEKTEGSVSQTVHKMKKKLPDTPSVVKDSQKELLEVPEETEVSNREKTGKGSNFFTRLAKKVKTSKS